MDSSTLITKKRLYNQLLPFAFIFSLFFAAPWAKAEGIIVTLPPLASIISMLDPQADITCLLPNNADPHHFQLSPRQLERLQKADLLIRTSKDDGGWTISAGNTPTLDVWSQDDHAWLNPVRVKQALPRIANTLQQHQPSQKEAIQQRLQQAMTSLDQEEKAWRTTLSRLKSKGVILQHPSWRHLLKAYGVPIHAILESHQHGREHGPHMLEHGLEILQQHPQAILLGDQSHSNRTLQWLSNHSDHTTPVVLLNAMSPCGQNWFDFMRLNRENLSKQLQPRQP